MGYFREHGVDEYGYSPMDYNRHYREQQERAPINAVPQDAIPASYFLDINTF
jgi:hypothetical protein